MLTPIKNTKVYEQVIEQIKNSVKMGLLKSGDKLPPERELAEQLQVSRTSIREALRALEMLGLIEARQGEGNFIRENFENNLLEPLSIVFMLLGSRKEEILDFRKIIEPEMAAAAATRITEEELLEIEKIKEQIVQTDNEEKAAELDKNFHYKILNASGNLLITNIMNAIELLIADCIKEVRVKISDKKILEKQHEDIFNALKQQDRFKASKAMREHLNYFS